VPITHEEADEPSVRIVELLLPAGEAHASGVGDRQIVGHRGIEADEAVVKELDPVALADRWRTSRFRSIAGRAGLWPVDVGGHHLEV
jgi:hypothetical protein